MVDLTENEVKLIFQELASWEQQLSHLENVPFEVSQNKTGGDK